MDSIFTKDYPDFQEFGDPPCSTTDPDAFFTVDPPDGNKVYSRGVYEYEREAKSICFTCPYQARCLEYALKYPDLMGIWGGTTERQRVAIRKMR